MEKLIRPKFGKTFRGFDQKQVNDYLTLLESELEILKTQRGKNNRDDQNQQEQITRLNEQLSQALAEAEALRSENNRLTSANRELEFSVQEEKRGQERLQAELKQMRDAAAEMDFDPNTIQNAILSAQRMGDIIVQEANQKAEELRTQADEAYSAAQEEMDQLVQKRSLEADALVSSAQRKCEELKSEYDHILMDVSGFKAEMIGLYRRHLELLYKLPDYNMLDEAQIVEEAEVTE